MSLPRGVCVAVAVVLLFLAVGSPVAAGHPGHTGPEPTQVSVPEDDSKSNPLLVGGTLVMLIVTAVAMAGLKHASAQQRDS